MGQKPEKRSWINQTSLLIAGGIIVVSLVFFVVGFVISMYIVDNNNESGIRYASTERSLLPRVTTTSEPTIGVTITFENEVTNDDKEFKATSNINTIAKSAYEIMRDLEAKDGRFRFTTKEHKDFGHFVTNVQGIGADWDNDKTYWAFLKRTDDVDCSISMGISIYIPSEGEHLVLSLVKSSNNIVSCADVGKPTTPEPTIGVLITFENVVTNDEREFRVTTNLSTTLKSTYDLMRDIEQKDDRFRFTTSEHKDFGHFVTEVNGVASDWDNEKTFWAFLKRTDSVDCSISMGISTYIPSEGEHVVLSLQKSPNNIVSCSELHKATTPEPELTIGVWITFENVVTNDKREFRATTDLNTTQKTTYDILRELEKGDSRFRFTTKEHKDFGHYVTHIRGVASDWDNEQTYWAFLRRTNDVDCTLSMGISGYIPSEGEHLVLSLQKSNNNLASCSSLAKTTPQSPPDVITIVYTVESSQATVSDGNFPASLNWNTTRKVFLEIMYDVQAANLTSFRFGLDSHQTVIRVQNSLATSEVSWMLLYRNATSDCTIAEGVTVYIPKDHDHLVLSLAKPDDHLRC